MLYVPCSLLMSQENPEPLKQLLQEKDVKELAYQKLSVILLVLLPAVPSALAAAGGWSHSSLCWLGF